MRFLRLMPSHTHLLSLLSIVRCASLMQIDIKKSLGEYVRLHLPLYLRVKSAQASPKYSLDGTRSRYDVHSFAPAPLGGMTTHPLMLNCPNASGEVNPAFCDDHVQVMSVIVAIAPLHCPAILNSRRHRKHDSLAYCRELRPLQTKNFSSKTISHLHTQS